MDAYYLLPQPCDAHLSPQCASASRVAAMIPCASTDRAEAVADGILALHQSILKLEVGTLRLFDIAVVALPVHSPRPVRLYSTGNIAAMNKLLNCHCCGTEGTAAAQPLQRDLSPSRRPPIPPDRPQEGSGGVATAPRVLARVTLGGIERKTSDGDVLTPFPGPLPSPFQPFAYKRSPDVKALARGASTDLSFSVYLVDADVEARVLERHLGLRRSTSAAGGICAAARTCSKRAAVRYRVNCVKKFMLTIASAANSRARASGGVATGTVACQMKAGLATFTQKAVILSRIVLSTDDTVSDADAPNVPRRIGMQLRSWKTKDL
jgi:hypothetical protein